MSDDIYHIKIKKEYASATLEDLQQVDAIEIVEAPLLNGKKRSYAGGLLK